MTKFDFIDINELMILSRCFTDMLLTSRSELSYCVTSLINGRVVLIYLPLRDLRDIMYEL
jgi:hypothetical protein